MRGLCSGGKKGGQGHKTQDKSYFFVPTVAPFSPSVTKGSLFCSPESNVDQNNDCWKDIVNFYNFDKGTTGQLL